MRTLYWKLWEAIQSFWVKQTSGRITQQPYKIEIWRQDTGVGDGGLDTCKIWTSNNKVINQGKKWGKGDGYERKWSCGHRITRLLSWLLSWTQNLLGVVSRSCHYLWALLKKHQHKQLIPFNENNSNIHSVVPEAVYVLHLASFSCLIVAVFCLFV